MSKNTGISYAAERLVERKTKTPMVERFLVQVSLIGRFMSKATTGQSMCHQMIMGAGKTTVVAPTLGLLLADGQRLVMEVS